MLCYSCLLQEMGVSYILCEEKLKVLIAEMKKEIAEARAKMKENKLWRYPITDTSIVLFKQIHLTLFTRFNFTVFNDIVFRHNSRDKRGIGIMYAAVL